MLQRAAHRGFVTGDKAAFVIKGLRYGFLCGVDVTLMQGEKWYKNYPSSLKPWPQVSKAVGKRLAAAKTLCLGAVLQGSKDEIPYDKYCVFPMGAVEKKGTKEYATALLMTTRGRV